MAEQKKLYWLKLKTDFFTSKEMKKLRKIAGGDTYTIIYLKLQLLSLQDGGTLYFDGVEESFAEELALILDEEPDNVKATLLFLERCGLAQINEAEIRLLVVPTLIGKESESAGRVRAFREKRKMLQSNGETLQCNTLVTKCNTDIDKEIEKEKEKEKNKKENAGSSSTAARVKPVKHQHGEYSNVLLTAEELQKLASEFPNDYQERIEQLSRYMKSTGKVYKDHLATIRNWARRDGAQKASGPKAEQINQGRTYDYDAEASKSFHRLMEKMNKAKAENAGANAAIYAALEAKKREKEGNT